ncbi:MAG TPA: hypothetical protein VFR04_09680 [Solirubrobacterales bacterium]|nr:hypothetical protein [Solirubrobacterales bacterium]
MHAPPAANGRSGKVAKAVKAVAKWRGPLLFLLAAALVVLGFHLLGFSVSSDNGDDEAGVATGGPVEFLYLDTGRVASYVAQVSGGTFEQQKVTNKMTDSLDAKVVLTGLGEAGADRAREVFLERVLKPTDASSFFALQDSLEGEDGELEDIRLRYFDEDPEDLHEGQMVRFETDALLSPLYLNSYLAVKQAHTLEAMFPDSEERQEAAEGFYDDVGRNPRVVFALQPTALPGSADGGESFKFLLPMSANGLTKERSLYKNGGGQFTVVGKLVRLFREKAPAQVPAYVDSPTLETWEQPLLNEPRELLCRTERHCIEQVRKEHLEGEERLQAIREARERVREALKQQTTIDRQGAVILPVAIYK